MFLIAPPLISADSNERVAFGILIIVSVLPCLYLLARSVCKSIQGKLNQ